MGRRSPRPLTSQSYHARRRGLWQPSPRLGLWGAGGEKWAQRIWTSTEEDGEGSKAAGYVSFPTAPSHGGVGRRVFFLEGARHALRCACAG
uniref:Uncharacterized protein n=1 Tax=Aegilops tauschii subsp. strangulata TaxID=200361 RepID=A0A453P4N3_AEGTS